MCLKKLIASMHTAKAPSIAERLLAWTLLPLSAAYALGVVARVEAYRLGLLKTVEPGVPVISIGNLTTGGTGKTPIVIELARGLVKAGKSVVVLSRGYGAKKKTDYARANDPQLGDEAYLIQQHVPEAAVIVGADRVYTLERAIIDYRPDYVLLDDGFQHLRLGRSVNILLIDGDNPVGNGHLLPAGPMREPLSAIARADLIFVTKSVTSDVMQQVETWANRYGGKVTPTVMPVPFQVAGLRNVEHNKILNAENTRSRKVVAVSAIARPEQFEQGLEGLGLEILKHFSFADHHNYRPIDVETVLYFYERQDEKPMLVTTEKDLPKLLPLLPEKLRPRICTLQICPALDGQWFYHEFLTQMPAISRFRDSQAQPSGR